MERKQSEVEGLLGPLYAAVGSREGWTPFLEHLCAGTDSHAGTLALFDAGGGGTLPAYVGAGADVARLYESRFAAENPWRTSGGAPGTVRASDDFLPWAQLRATEFYGSFLRPLDVAHGVGLIGATTDGRTPSLTVLRSRRHGAYRGTDRILLEHLAPHWVNAAALWSRLDAAERPATDIRAAMDRQALGVWLIDGEGRLLQTNAAGSQMLAAGAVWVRNGRLVARQPADRPALAAALLRAARSSGSPQVGLVLRDTDGRPVAALGVHRMSGPSAAAGTRLMIFVQPVDAPGPGLSRLLQEALGLTPGEARLAAGLSQHRGDLGAAARALGVSPGAARTRLKVVLHKAGVGSQVELLGVLRALEETAGLAPPV